MSDNKQMTIDSQRKSAELHLNYASKNLKRLAKRNKDKKLINSFTRKWLDVFSKSDILTRDLERKLSTSFTKFEEYEYPLSFNTKEYTFIISWDINLLSTLSKSSNLEKTSIPNDYVVIGEQSINLDSNYIKIENPIMIINPCILTNYQHLVINGTHRITELKKKSVEFSEGYVYSDNFHLKAMRSDLMRDFYLMAQDLVTISNYIQNPSFFRSKKKFSGLNVYKK